MDDKPTSKRPFIGMHFRCCNVYTRLYLDREQMVFQGGCPRCGRVAVIKARPGGNPSKFWTAG